MKIEQSGVFRRRAKRLKGDEKLALDKAVKSIIDDPSLGQMKLGDLVSVQAYKYKHKTQQYLLAYRVDKDRLMLTLLAIGTHENFYRDLKRQ